LIYSECIKKLTYQLPDVGRITMARGRFWRQAGRVMSHQDTNKAKSCTEFIAAAANMLLLLASDPTKQPCADESHGCSLNVPSKHC
jgi:hypothetical protein